METQIPNPVIFGVRALRTSSEDLAFYNGLQPHDCLRMFTVSVTPVAFPFLCACDCLNGHTEDYEKKRGSGRESQLEGGGGQEVCDSVRQLQLHR